MTEEQKADIIENAKEFFTQTIALNHVENTKKLTSLQEFNVNPFLNTYLARFAFGDSSPISVAKALIYPRALGTSITTSFGANMQKFCNNVLNSYASLVSGIDIEFDDALDGRRKYCQVKAGPNTINKDDVETIINHFNSVRNLARANSQSDINPSRDCIVGVLYGNPSDLSGHYKKLNQSYPVICGKEFWHRLTGDEGFYLSLSEAMTEAALDVNGQRILNDTITELARQIAARE